MRLLLATRNRHKTKEISSLLSGASVEVVCLEDFPALKEVDEDRPTLEGNAEKKARENAAGSGLWALADDTGLEVEALNGAPGVYSARYAGEGCSYEDNCRKLLGALAGVPAEKRTAAFRTVMALCSPDGKVILEDGRLEGSITEAPRGTDGFGYDPIFQVTKLGKTLAELTLEEKNRISHRAIALEKMFRRIKGIAFAVLMLGCLTGPSWADKTEPGQTTIWDEIMASQAYRGLRLGSRYLDDHKYEQAEKEFQRAVMASPKDANAHMMLGAAYYWTGKVDLALHEYHTSLGLDPKNAQAYMLLGIALAWKGENGPAYEAFKKAGELDPNRADVQMNIGSIEEALGKVPEALDHFRRAVALDPKHPLYHFQLGMLYRRLGRDSDAVESMRAALKLYPAYEDALLELGAADERMGDKKAAINSFRRAVGLKSRDSVARFRLGRLYLLTGDREKAREVFAEAFHLTPEGEGTGLQLSLSFAGGKKNGPQMETGAKPGGNTPPPPSNDPLDVLARNLERIPAEQGAIMQMDVAFVPKPKLEKADASEVPSSLKKALEKAAGRERGAKIVRKEFSLPPASPDLRGRQIDKIIDDLRQAMKEAPPDADVRLGMNLTFTRLAEQTQPSGKNGGGDAGDTPKVSYQPREVGNDMGLWVIGTGWVALIEEVQPESGDSHPDESDWWVAEGLGYAAVGEGQKALRAFDRAARLDPKSEAAHLGRGVASVMVGNEADAIYSYEEALKLNPKNRAAREGLKWLRRPSRVKKETNAR
jgi:XTP/dITP diphosphohydrolase